MWPQIQADKALFPLKIFSNYSLSKTSVKLQGTQACSVQGDGSAAASFLAILKDCSVAWTLTVHFNCVHVRISEETKTKQQNAQNELPRAPLMDLNQGLGF